MKFTEINNILFLVDTDIMALRHGRKFEKTIRLSETEIIPQGYRARFKGSELIIPHFVKLDPDGMRKRFSLPSNTILPENDHDLKCSKKLYKKRIETRAKPMITAGKWKYYFNYKHLKLITEVIPNGKKRPISIPLSKMERFDFGKRFLIDNRTGIPPLPGEVIPKEHLFIVEIPHAKALDNVGFNQFWGELNSPDTLQHPVRYNFEARFGNFYKNNLYPRPTAKRIVAPKKNRGPKR
ncbi:hypothetical protein ACQKLP_11015 [Chitinophaga sp. NPDC101104]|uniref:hypothetical protein n=1 Tax=Chitinophaga sp. NPDC101104 TaxID=3390561 RepID=UPI003D00FED0